MSKRDIHKVLYNILYIIFIATLIICIMYSKSILAYIQKIIDILAPFIYGGCMAYILVPLCNNIERKLSKINIKFIKKHLRSIAITITEIVFIGILMVVIIIILPQSIESVKDIIKSFPTAIENTQKLVNEKLLTHEFIRELAGNKLTNIEKTITTLIKNKISPNFQAILTSVLNSATSIGKFVLDIVMAIFVNIFILANRSNFAAYLKDLIKAIFGDKISQLIMEELAVVNKMFGGFFFGKIVDSLIIGILCFIVLTIMNMPYTLLVSVIVGVTNIIPIAGPFIGAIPGAIIIFSASPLQSLYFIIFVFILQQVDGNIIGPKCIGSATNLSTFWVLFAIIFFGGLFGIIGMVIGVPILAIIFDLLNKIINYITKRRNTKANKINSNTKNNTEK